MPMALSSHNRIEHKAIIFACVFVFGILSLGLANKATASCGDYLVHSGSQNIGSSQIAGQQIAGQLGQKHGPASDESSTPFSQCKNGRCKAAPFSVPNSPTRVFLPRQQPDHFLISSFKYACQLTGMLTICNESLPTEPSLDLLDPPPRAASL